MLVRVANREDTDLDLHCWSRLFLQATSIKILEHLPYIVMYSARLDVETRCLRHLSLHIMWCMVLGLLY